MSNIQSKKRFGTDGIRGLANVGPLNVGQVLKLGEATAVLLKKRLKRNASVGLGWDTRISSPAIAAALAAGLSSGGAKVVEFGVIPTPAVARLVIDYKMDAGIVISASHNHSRDNGIKYFDASGGKFPDKYEAALERQLDQDQPIKPAIGQMMGIIEEVYADSAMRYQHQVVKQFKNAGLKGLHIIVDMANGATCRTAPGIFDVLGIQVKAYGDRPDGLNINDGVGSLYPQKVAGMVKRFKADAGLAFDGDGDRVMVIDELGHVLNGDRLIGILANHYKRKGQLKNKTVVTTVMSNLGFERYLTNQGIKLLRAKVGDRYVSEMMTSHQSILGGEQSGHILLPKMTTTGDGMVTALAVLAVMQSENKPLSVLAGGWNNYPQLLINIPVSRRPDLMQLPKVKQVAKMVTTALGVNGRFNCRYSGTEPLARVMVEAANKKDVLHWADKLAKVIEEEIGSGKKRSETWLTCA